MRVIAHLPEEFNNCSIIHSEMEITRHQNQREIRTSLFRCLGLWDNISGALSTTALYDGHTWSSDLNGDFAGEFCELEFFGGGQSDGFTICPSENNWVQLDEDRLYYTCRKK